jgi:hypothetical protein
MIGSTTEKSFRKAMTYNSKVEMTLRYCHPSKATVQKAVSVLGDFWSKISSNETIEHLSHDCVSHSNVNS